MPCPHLPPRPLVESAALQVECANCGGGLGVEFWVPIGLTVLALVIAGVALVMNLREHRVFLKRLNARARFKITRWTRNADGDDVMRHAIESANNIKDGEHAGGRIIPRRALPGNRRYVLGRPPRPELRDQGLRKAGAPRAHRPGLAPGLRRAGSAPRRREIGLR